MRRRTFLRSVGTVAATGTAGCTVMGGTPTESGGALPAVRLEMDAVSVAGLPSKALYSVADASDRRASLLDRITDGGTSTQATRPPLPENEHLTDTEAVYELSYEVIDRTPATRYSVRVDVVTESVPGSETIRFADLPAVDQRALADNDLADGDVYGVGFVVLYTDTARARSVLVPDPEYTYIVWDSGPQVRWVVGDATEKPMKTYRYTARTVASAASYGRQMRNRFAFTLSDLSAAETEIIETATRDGYVVGLGDTPSSELTGLVDRFREREQAHGLAEDGAAGLTGSYLVRYKGALYWTTLVVNTDLTPTTPSG